MKGKKIIILCAILALIGFRTWVIKLLIGGLIGYLLLYYFKGNLSEEIEKRKEVPEDVDSGFNEFQGVINDCKRKNDEIVKFKQSVDLRQFKGRKDVTQDEVKDYIIAHHRYEGFFKICYRLQMIADSCNLDSNDVAEIRQLLYLKVPFNEDKDMQKESEYRKKMAREEEEKKKKWWLEHGMSNDIVDDIDDKYMMTYYYEDWLKKKGYV